MSQLNHILALPEKAQVDKRLTKAFFLDKLPLLATEKRFTNNVTLTMRILGSIKQETANVPAYTDEDSAYNEILIIYCSLTDDKFESTAQRCFELIQKYIPHHLLILAASDTQMMVNACTKHINQADKSKRTIERHYTTAPFSRLHTTAPTVAFLEQLAFENLDKNDLQQCYQSYSTAIINFNISNVSGEYKLRTTSRSAEDLKLLDKIQSLEQEVTVLRNKLKSESQVNAQVEINMAIRECKIEIERKKEQISQ